MHARRFIPHRLDRHRLIAAALTCAALTSVGCVSDRYVGQLSPNNGYANRGYGVAIDFTQEGLADRWTVIDPQAPETAPPGLAPIVRDLPLDLDGDGYMHHDEVVRYMDPMLRIVSKTSTATWIDIHVDILGGEKNSTADLNALMVHYLATVTGKEHGAHRYEKRTLAPDFEARVGEIVEEGIRLGIIDHRPYRAENGIQRRQLFRIVLRTDKITAERRADHNFVMQAFTLNHESGPLTRQERF